MIDFNAPGYVNAPLPSQIDPALGGWVSTTDIGFINVENTGTNGRLVIQPNPTAPFHNAQLLLPTPIAPDANNRIIASFDLINSPEGADSGNIWKMMFKDAAGLDLASHRRMGLPFVGRENIRPDRRCGALGSHLRANPRTKHALGVRIKTHRDERGALLVRDSGIEHGHRRDRARVGPAAPPRPHAHVSVDRSAKCRQSRQPAVGQVRFRWNLAEGHDFWLVQARGRRTDGTPSNSVSVKYTRLFTFARSGPS